MKRSVSILAVFAALVLISCNMIGRKDEILARVGDHDLMQSELDFAVGSMPVSRRADPSSRKMVFNNLLDSRIAGEAARRYAPQAAPVVEGKLSALRQRDLASIYQHFYLSTNLGHTDAELFAWFRKHQNEFKAKDSTQKPEFNELRDSVITRMALSGKDEEVHKFFEDNKIRYKDRDSADIGLLKSTDSLALAKAVEKITKGASFDSIAVLLLKDKDLLAKKGHLGLIRQGVSRPELMPIGGAANQLFNKTARPTVGAFLPIVPTMKHKIGKDGVVNYYALTAFEYRDAADPTFEKVKNRVEADFLKDMRQKLVKSSSDSLHKKYKVEMIPIPPPDAKKFYEDHKDEFKTQQVYKVLHIESTDSAKLTQAIQGVKTEADFRTKAKMISENTETKTNGGELGEIKVGHCLPAGIGMLPDLFAQLNGRTPGYMTPVIKAPDTQKYQVFWLLQSIAPTVKPFDRAEKEAQMRMTQGSDTPLDSNFVLVKIDGAPAIWEKDVMRLQEEVPPQQRRAYPRQRLVNFLLDWNLADREAVLLDLDEGPQYKALCALRASDVWASIYRDSVMNHNLGKKTSDLQKVLQENPGKIFEDRTLGKAALDAALWLDIPDYAYQREFALHPDRYPESKTWKEAKTAIFRHIKGSEIRGSQIRLKQRVKNELGVEVLDTTLAKKEPETAQELMNAGKKAYETRDLAEARTYFQKIRDLYPEDTANFRASMMIAQTYNEEEHYTQALDEYTVLYALWPQHPEAYKSLFMKGFILSENLKKDSLALPIFQELLSKYPKSDLSDDADWMVRNIQSGGKLAPALLDSIAKQDSLQNKPEKAALPTAKKAAQEK